MKWKVGRPPMRYRPLVKCMGRTRWRKVRDAPGICCVTKFISIFWRKKSIALLGSDLASYCLPIEYSTTYSTKPTDTTATAVSRQSSWRDGAYYRLASRFPLLHGTEVPCVIVITLNNIVYIESPRNLRGLHNMEICAHEIKHIATNQNVQGV